MTILMSVLSLCGVVGQPQSDCIPARPNLQDMPLLVSWYDPAVGGINCGGEGCDNLSLAAMDSGFYGSVAACPAELVGLDVTAVVQHPSIGEWACLDRGGAVEFKYGYLPGYDLWLWYGVIDLLVQEPHPMVWDLLYGWQIVRWESPRQIEERLLN